MSKYICYELYPKLNYPIDQSKVKDIELGNSFAAGSFGEVFHYKSSTIPTCSTEGECIIKRIKSRSESGKLSSREFTNIMLHIYLIEKYPKLQIPKIYEVGYMKPKNDLESRNFSFVSGAAFCPVASGWVGSRNPRSRGWLSPGARCG